MAAYQQELRLLMVDENVFVVPLLPRVVPRMRLQSVKGVSVAISESCCGPSAQHARSGKEPAVGHLCPIYTH